MKKALVIINLSKDESMALAKQISSSLEKRNFETDFFSFDGFCDNATLSGYDVVITLGGDGTVLFAARNAVENSIPIFPVNLGEFGFIASIQPEEWESQFDAYLAGNVPVEERSMLKISIIRDNKEVYSSLGLNDVVISAKRAATTISLDVKYNDLHLCKLKSDGVIVSTSTGSTAYSAAAGGPIVDPNLSAFVITPVNSFSLSSRPIVLSPDGKLTMSIENSRTKETSITVDGQEPFSLQIGDKVIVEQNEKKVRLIACTSEKFYNALRSKLNWSGVPHA